MKAVITLTADARGVQAGVNAALQQVQRLQNAVADIRSLFVGGMIGDFLRQAVNHAVGEFSRLKDLGSAFSMEGAMAAAQLQMERMRSDMTLGKALGPASARADEITAQALREVTSYLVANKDAISQALVNLAVFGAAAAHALAEFTVRLSEVINKAANIAETINPANLVEAPGKFSQDVRDVLSTVDPTGSIVGPTQSYLMDYTPAGRILQLLERKLGGN
jgi:hypothetical protein